MGIKSSMVAASLLVASAFNNQSEDQASQFTYEPEIADIQRQSNVPALAKLRPLRINLDEDVLDVSRPWQTKKEDLGELYTQCLIEVEDVYQNDIPYSEQSNVNCSDIQKTLSEVEEAIVACEKASNYREPLSLYVGPQIVHRFRIVERTRSKVSILLNALKNYQSKTMDASRHCFIER